MDGKRAGFALIRVVNGVNVFAEFFVMRSFRGHGVGAAAARAVFALLAGNWLVHQVPANVPAQAFWRRVVSELTRGNYREEVDESGVTQRFILP